MVIENYHTTDNETQIYISSLIEQFIVVTRTYSNND